MALADDVKAKLEAGRGATARALRALADEIEKLPVDAAAETLAALAPDIERLWREAETILGGGPRRPKSGR